MSQQASQDHHEPAGVEQLRGKKNPDALIRCAVCQAQNRMAHVKALLLIAVVMGPVSLWE